MDYCSFLWRAESRASRQRDQQQGDYTGMLVD